MPEAALASGASSSKVRGRITEDQVGSLKHDGVRCVEARRALVASDPEDPELIAGVAGLI